MYIGKSPADVLIGPTVSSVDISDETIATIDIAADAITGAKIADDAINSEHYTDGSIDNVHVATGLDAVKIADGSVTNAELQYINSLSSNAQTQISTKSPIASPTFTGTVVLPNVPAIVTTQLDLKSPLASPTFTGTPAAPTASAATNTTQLATTAFVRTEVTNLIDSAPSALDTLNELAAALGDDASFSTTVTNSIATKLPLAGGTLTGGLSGTTGTFSGAVEMDAGSFVDNTAHRGYKVTNGSDGNGYLWAKYFHVADSSGAHKLCQAYDFQGFLVSVTHDGGNGSALDYVWIDSSNGNPTVNNIVESGTTPSRTYTRGNGWAMTYITLESGKGAHKVSIIKLGGY